MQYETKLPRRGSWAVWFWIETNNQLRTLHYFGNCTHIFLASSCYRRYIDSNHDFLQQTEYFNARDTRYELTSQSQTGLSQSVQPSKQLASHGQSEMISLKINYKKWCILPFKHSTLSLEHSLIQRLSLSQFKMHSIEMTSQRSLQASLRSGTLNLISVLSPRYKLKKTYKHSSKGSKSSGWPVTKFSIGIKKENLILWNSFKQRDALWKKPYANFSHRLETPKGYHDFIQN